MFLLLGQCDVIHSVINRCNNSCTDVLLLKLILFQHNNINHGLTELVWRMLTFLH